MSQYIELTLERTQPSLGLELKAPGSPEAAAMAQVATGPTGSVASISADGNNRITTGTDGGLFVPDEPVTDPLAYYILSKS